MIYYKTHYEAIKAAKKTGKTDIAILEKEEGWYFVKITNNNHKHEKEDAYGWYPIGNKRLIF